MLHEDDVGFGKNCLIIIIIQKNSNINELMQIGPKNIDFYIDEWWSENDFKIRKRPSEPLHLWWSQTGYFLYHSHFAVSTRKCIAALSKMASSGATKFYSLSAFTIVSDRDLLGKFCAEEDFG